MPRAGDAIPHPTDPVKLTAHAIPSTPLCRLRRPISLPVEAVMSTQSPATTPNARTRVLSSGQSSAEVMCLQSVTPPLVSTNPHG